MHTKNNNKSNFCLGMENLHWFYGRESIWAALIKLVMIKNILTNNPKDKINRKVLKLEL